MYDLSGKRIWVAGHRGLTLTPSGRELLEDVRRMGDAAQRVSVSAGGRSEAIDGTIRITASEVYAFVLLPPIIRKLREVHPGIQVQVVASTGPTDLLRREADIAIRNFVSTQPDLIARKIRDDHAHLYATPDYLRSIGNPKTLQDLEKADFLGFYDTDMMVKGLNGLGLNLTERNFTVTCNSHLVQWSLVKAGVGVGGITENVGEHEPLVRRALPDMPPMVVPMWLVAHRELHTGKRVRTVFDFLASHLTGEGE